MEHFASSIIMRKVAVAINNVKNVHHEGQATVLLFTPEKERHEIPILVMQYLLKKNGIKTISLGQHVSLETLDAYCRSARVTHLYTHIITHLQRCDMDEYIAALSKKFHDKQIVIAGAVVQPMQRNFTNVKILRTDEDMAAFSSELK
jgi:hypothetical protein